MTAKEELMDLYETIQSRDDTDRNRILELIRKSKNLSSAKLDYLIRLIGLLFY